MKTYFIYEFLSTVVLIISTKFKNSIKFFYYKKFAVMHFCAKFDNRFWLIMQSKVIVQGDLKKCAPRHISDKK